MMEWTMGHTKATFGRNHISRVRWEKSEIVADAVRAISNRCLLASVQLLQPDQTVHKAEMQSLSPYPSAASLPGLWRREVANTNIAEELKPADGGRRI